jgi:D-arabinose 1-dehydrogenase-like Zn-dependent alcohol dehydrogenase
VSQACRSIASTIGCEIIVTSRHQVKLDRAKKRGAHHVILDKGQNILGSSMGSIDEFGEVTRLFTEGLIKVVVDWR